MILRQAYIIDGVVRNVVMAEEGWAPEHDAIAAPSEVAEIGWGYANGQFVPPAPPEPAPPPVPPTISYRQLVLGMYAVGTITAEEAQAMALRTLPAFLDTILQSMPAEQQTPLRITLATMTEVDRNNPAVDQIAAIMGGSPVATDEFFRMTAKL